MLKSTKKLNKKLKNSIQQFSIALNLNTGFSSLNNLYTTYHPTYWG